MIVRIGRNVDLILLAIALPVFLAANVTLAAWAVAAAAWLAQRGAEVLLQRRADASDDPRVVVAAIAGGAMARGLFTVLVGVFLPGLAFGDRAGLATALLVIVLFSLHFFIKLGRRAGQAMPGGGPAAR